MSGCCNMFCTCLMSTATDYRVLHVQAATLYQRRWVPQPRPQSLSACLPCTCFCDDKSWTGYPCNCTPAPQL
jgi:hypothetical protein